MDALDQRGALAILARGVLRRTAADGTRHWLCFWPAIPEPACYITTAGGVPVEAQAMAA